MIPRNEETNSEKFMYNSLLSVCGIIPRRQYDTILAEERWFLHKNLVWFHVIGRKQHNGHQLHQAFYFSRGAALGDPQLRPDVTLHCCLQDFAGGRSGLTMTRCDKRPVCRDKEVCQ